MRRDRRRPLLLFALVAGTQAGALAITSGGNPGVAALLGLVAASALAVLTWELTVLQPSRQALTRLAARVERLAGRTAGQRALPPGIPGQEAQTLERLSAVRHRHLAAYARRLRRTLQGYRAIFQHSHDAVMIFDPRDGRLVDANPGAAELLGTPLERLPGTRLFDIHADDATQLRALIDDVMGSPRGCSLRLDYRASDGRLIPAEVSASRIRLDDGDLLLCIARDISERESAAERIQHLAYHDTLTGLPNRALLTDRVSHALARTRRTGQFGALLFIDLDKFKHINDSLGHPVGDELLKELARRLRHALREEDTVARLGGDEFVVLLEGLGDQAPVAGDQAREITEKLRLAIAPAFELNGHELYVTASIGIVTFPEDGDSVDTLLRHADTAMYHAKGAGRDAARAFQRGMDEAATSRLRLENELRTALRDDQFELYLQPVMTLPEGRVLGAEVLLRWRHPTEGLIAPAEFLPYIENCALMTRLDDWVLREVCSLLSELQRDPATVTPQCLGVNVSHQQFQQTDFVDRVKATLDETGADPRHLQFEITETVLLKDAADSVARIHALKKLGIRFALDDFGTGYSSLTDLRQLPIDTLKIDRSFVRDITTDPNDAAIVRAILSMARHIGVQVVAEGVETREQLQFLREAACHYYQGHLGRPPIPAARFRDELQFSADLFASAPPAHGKRSVA